MNEEPDSRLTTLRSLIQSAVNESFDEKLVVSLLAAEDEMTENREHLVVLYKRGLVSDQEFTAKLNICFELFITQAGTILGETACRKIYDYGPGDKINIVTFSANKNVSRTFDWIIFLSLFFVIVALYHIHYMLTGGDWDLWSDWKDRRIWVTVTPIVSITFPVAVQAVLWYRFHLPFGAVLCILGLLLGKWINIYVNYWGWTYYPINFVFPLNLMPGAILLDVFLILTNSITFTTVIGGLVWGLLFYPGNWPIIGPLHVPVEYNGMLMTLADLQGYQYVRTGAPEYISMVEKGTLRTFGIDVAPVSAFFSGFVSIIIYFLWHFFGKWFSSVISAPGFFAKTR